MAPQAATQRALVVVAIVACSLLALSTQLQDLRRDCAEVVRPAHELSTISAAPSGDGAHGDLASAHSTPLVTSVPSPGFVDVRGPIGAAVPLLPEESARPSSAAAETAVRRTLSDPAEAPRPAAQTAIRANLTHPAWPQFHWESYADWHLAHWDHAWTDNRILREDLEDLEEICERGTGLIWCTRVQIIQRRLYVKDVRALELDRDYAVSRIAPLIDIIKAHPTLPNVDLMFGLNDQPQVAYNYRGPHARAHDVLHPPPMFGATLSPRTVDIPWPDYSFWLPTRPHKTRTPPWDTAREEILAAAAEWPWERKRRIAFFAGNMRHPVRQEMVQVANRTDHRDLFALRTVWIHKTERRCVGGGDGDIDDGGPGIRELGCRYAQPDFCRYRYLLNLGSGGNYANKLKYLLLCGSLIIHVTKHNAVRARVPALAPRCDPLPLTAHLSHARTRVRSPWQNEEFWQSHFVPGEHFIQVPSADHVPGVLRRLMTDPVAEAEGARIAAAGQARMAALTKEQVMSYCATILRGYARRMRFKAAPVRGAFEVNCVDDLWRHYEKDFREPWFAKMITNDNSSCLRPPTAPFQPPGYGGAYRGTKVPCLAANNLVLRQERCFPPSTADAKRLAYLDRIYNDSCGDVKCRID